jgi:archaellum component FlaC
MMVKISITYNFILYYIYKMNHDNEYPKIHDQCNKQNRKHDKNKIKKYSIKRLENDYEKLTNDYEKLTNDYKQLKNDNKKLINDYEKLKEDIKRVLSR